MEHAAVFRSGPSIGADDARDATATTTAAAARASRVSRRGDTVDEPRQPDVDAVDPGMRVYNALTARREAQPREKSTSIGVVLWRNEGRHADRRMQRIADADKFNALNA